MSIPYLKPTVTLLCYAPLLWLVLDALSSNLGSNPIQGLHIRLGDWTLRFLCITLAITPAQTVTGWKSLSPYRQLFGLITFTYGTLHVFVYLTVDHFFVWEVIATDIIESAYLWFGVVAYLIVLVLALTTLKTIKNLMGEHWKKLHKHLYLAAGAALLHYFWQLKGNLAEPLLYSTLIALLLVFRVFIRVKNQQQSGLMVQKTKK